MKKIQVVKSIQTVSSIPKTTRAKIVLPILNKLIDDGVDENEVNEYIKELDKEIDNLNINFGEL